MHVIIPVYGPETPADISFPFFLRVIARRTFTLSNLYFRTLLAVFVWLIWVPYMTVWIWRSYFDPLALFRVTPLERYVASASSKFAGSEAGALTVLLEALSMWLNGTLLENVPAADIRWRRLFQYVIGSLDPLFVMQ